MVTDSNSDFGSFLTDLWLRAGMDQRDFAKAVRQREPYICRVRLGRLLPPGDGVVEQWADAVGASPAERQQLLDLAALAHTPERIRRKFLRLSVAAVA
jgi:hypothetical protein